MNFTTDPRSVRVDIFKPGGKWQETISMTWLNYEGDMHEIFVRSLRAALGARYEGSTMVCLAPHHEHEHPMMLKGFEP
jgi:hypothetical protein